MASGSRSQGAIYDEFIVKLRDDLQGKGVISRVEYAGSRFKGTQTGSSDYDNMFVLKNTSIHAQPSNFPGFALLTKAGSKVNRDPYLAEFKKQVQQSLRSIDAASYTQIVNAYGPTVVVSYKKPGDPHFPIDMVYTLEVDGDLYVAKAPPGSGPDGSNLWYKTRVLDEKYKMRTIDAGNETGKWAVRRLKTLKEIETGLQAIVSYSFEQALMYLKDRKTDTMFWRENNMVEIIRAMLEFMEQALRKGQLLAYHDHSNNTIGGLSDSQRAQLANRFMKLAKNPQEVIDRTN